jgi:hypothetical protein
MSITACDTQQQTAPVKKHIEIKTKSIETPAKEKAVTPQKTPVLNMSIRNLSFEYHDDNDDLFLIDSTYEVENSELFNTLNSKAPESTIKFSGELLTDKNADINTDFHKAIDGINIKIQGSFD